MNLNNEWSRVELPEGNFSTSVLRLTADNQFGPWISIANNLQYDSVTRILGWQSRFRWIVRPGNNIYFVYIHNWIDDLTRGRYTLDRSAATKVIYTHSFSAAPLSQAPAFCTVEPNFCVIIPAIEEDLTWVRPQAN